MVVAAGAVSFAAGIPALATAPSAAAATSSIAWAQIAGGSVHTCGIDTNHGLWCWGYNGNGELGIGSTTNQDLPQSVTTPAAPGWATVTADGPPVGGHTCAIRTDHTLWCWGQGGSGQLGIGSTFDQDLPQQVTTPSATGWAATSAGGAHTCATRTDGTLWCWGKNGNGQLGIGSVTSEFLPQQVSTPAATGWAAVSAGGFHACATRTDGTLWCWGANYDGQLGIGSSGSKRLPQQVAKSATTPWATVSAGGYHSCVTRTNRTLWCWGYNAFGELGLGNTTIQYRPHQVTG